ncbi:MAG TPA: SIS domain-containing protein, partial [Solirubrobacterales bacterium]
ATRDEILRQPQAWRRLLEVAVPRHAAYLGAVLDRADEVLLVGAGSAHHVGLLAAPYLVEHLRRPARALLSSELFLDPAASLVQGRRYAVIAISRSGETTETIRAVEAARSRGYPTFGITARAGSPIAVLPDAAAALEEVDEQSVAATGSVTGELIFLAGCVAALTKSEELRGQLAALPGLAERRLPDWDAAAAAMAAELAPLAGRRLVFLGGGRLAATAREAALKALEMASLPAVAYPLLDYRHGPQAVADGDLLVALTDRDAPEEHDLIVEMAARGTPVWLVTDRADLRLRELARWTSEVGVDLGADQLPIAFLPPLQLFAYHAAVQRGRDPDRPAHLSYAVRLH